MNLGKQEIYSKQNNSTYPTLGRVIECFTTENISSKNNIFPGSSGIGAVFFESIRNIQGLNTSYAKPLFPQIKYYPLINEIIWIIQGPEYSTPDNSSLKNLYYINNFNSFNSSHINPHPILNGEISFGNTFHPKYDIQSLISFEGDLILEGRWGNSIRFGSSISSSNLQNQWSENPKTGDPITIIRNGQTYNTSSIDITLENIDSDLTSIYLTSTQPIPINVSSKNLDTFNLKIKPVTSSIFIPNIDNNNDTYQNVG